MSGGKLGRSASYSEANESGLSAATRPHPFRLGFAWLSVQRDLLRKSCTVLGMLIHRICCFTGLALLVACGDVVPMFDAASSDAAPVSDASPADATPVDAAVWPPDAALDASVDASLPTCDAYQVPLRRSPAFTGDELAFQHGSVGAFPNALHATADGAGVAPDNMIDFRESVRVDWLRDAYGVVITIADAVDGPDTGEDVAIVARNDRESRVYKVVPGERLELDGYMTFVVVTVPDGLVSLGQVDYHFCPKGWTP